jgi:hypothetical protein
MRARSIALEAYGFNGGIGMIEYLQNYPWSILLKFMGVLIFFALIGFAASRPRKPDIWNGPEGEGGEWL